MAKDMLAIQVSVTSLDDAVRDFDEPLTSLGLLPAPYASDHVPAGRHGDQAQCAKRLWSRRGHSGGDVNLHVRRAGSANERLALLFRDWFRADPHAVPAHAAVKRAQAAATPDTGTYSDTKDPRRPPGHHRG